MKRIGYLVFGISIAVVIGLFAYIIYQAKEREEQNKQWQQAIKKSGEHQKEVMDKAYKGDYGASDVLPGVKIVEIKEEGK